MSLKLAIGSLALYCMFVLGIFGYFKGHVDSGWIAKKSDSPTFSKDLCQSQMTGEPSNAKDYIKLYISCKNGTTVRNTFSRSAIGGDKFYNLTDTFLGMFNNRSDFFNRFSCERNIDKDYIITTNETINCYEK